MAKITLTDRFVKTRKAAAPGRRDEYPDAVVPGLVLIVTETGHRSFVLRVRFPSHPKNPTRRALGVYGRISLDDARRKAREWFALIERGIDPQTEAMRKRAAAQRSQLNTFGTVAKAFLDRHAATLKKEGEARRIIEVEFVKRWGDRPITDITAQEAAAAIRAIVDRGAPAQAHNSLSYLRLLFRWAIGTGEYGIDASPTDRLQPAKLIGTRGARERTLTDVELRAVWDAAGQMGYPYCPLLRLLILTGQREREIANISWSEIDLDKRLLTIPGARMKGGRAHEVPLAPNAMALIKALPLWRGPFVFTTTRGEKPVNGFSKAKRRIDRLCGVTGWVFHDLRRTMRTHISALPVQDLVRELVIAHTRPGLHKVYDKHAYLDEKRECLDLWERRLLGIVDPPAPNVTDLQQVRSSRAG